MSTAYFIVLDNDNPGFDTFVNGKSLAAEAQHLAAISATLGLPTFDDFVSMDLGEICDEDEMNTAAAALPWFTADEGLAFIAALRSYVTQHPTVFRNTAGVLADLDEYATVLASAKAIGAQWHFTVDF